MKEQNATMPVFTFDVRSMLYNVYVVSESPCGGAEPHRDEEPANVDPLDWDRACQWMRGIWTQIGIGSKKGKVVDAYLLPVSCPRPWSAETYGAFLREIRRYRLEVPTPQQVAAEEKVEQLRGQLHGRPFIPFPMPEKKFTPCGVDEMMVVCPYDPDVKDSCFYTTGPCATGKAQGGANTFCCGSTAYTSQLASEKETRPTYQQQKERQALSRLAAALFQMKSLDDYKGRDNLHIDTMLDVRKLVGNICLTTLVKFCPWCKEVKGEMEGNGATGETNVICPECRQQQEAEHAPNSCAHVAAALMDTKERTFEENIVEGFKLMSEGSFAPPLFGTEADGALLMETIREELQPHELRYGRLTS